jgi:hypothetical protein
LALVPTATHAADRGKRAVLSQAAEAVAVKRCRADGCRRSAMRAGTREAAMRRPPRRRGSRSILVPCRRAFLQERLSTSGCADSVIVSRATLVVAPANAVALETWRGRSTQGTRRARPPRVVRASATDRRAGRRR